MLHARLRLLAMLPLMLAGCHRGQPASARGREVARLLRIEGPVLLRHRERLAPASVGPLADGDLLSTGSAGRATISLASGRTVTLSSGATLELAGTSKAPQLTLRDGALECEGPASGSPGKLTLLTAFGKVALPPAPSEIRLESSGGSARVEIRQGVATLSGPGGKPKLETRAGRTYRITLKGIDPVEPASAPSLR